ncbi:uncharacterized protein LOC126234856 [Schistocerca nitens]|uniref:uncharacterized protein LOC126234856 n=1 Tax=Schistocerca nitens TaxID=7011 RepID=UPI002117406D|nr:uncharacterized protein LOC126234856 [Schistocerca nitens]
MDEIDTELLITLVEVRPVLWDKTLDAYRDRIATKNAWREVCVALKQDFDEMEDKDKNAFGIEVIRRWTNLRDSFVKSNIKIQAAKKSGSAAKKMKKYVYSDQLQFLKKLYDARETEDSFQSERTARLEEDIETQGSVENTENVSGPFDTAPTQQTSKSECHTNRKHRKPDAIEMKILRALEEDKPCSKMSFLLSLKPHLEKFDEQDYLQFQMGVLKVIENIYERRNILTAQPPPFTHYTPPMPYNNRFQAYSYSPMENAAPISSYHTHQIRPPPAAPNPTTFLEQPLQTSQGRSSYQRINKVPPPYPSPSTSSHEGPPSTTQFYNVFAESLSPQSDSTRRLAAEWEHKTSRRVALSVGGAPRLRSAVGDREAGGTRTECAAGRDPDSRPGLQAQLPASRHPAPEGGRGTTANTQT